MEIIVNQNKLQGALRIVEKVVSKNQALPILNTILIKTENGRLRLSATNLEIGVNHWLGAKVDQEGEIAIPARIFSDFISNIRTERVSMRSEKNVLHIQSDNYATQILGMETSEFPIIPSMNNVIQFKINKLVLKNALASVIDAVSLSEIRPELNGIYVNISGGHAQFAATDSFRLAEKLVDVSDSIEKSFILPRATALEILRIVDNLEDDVDIALSDNQIFIYNADFQLVSRLIDGRYPEYKRIIPTNFISFLKLNKQEFDKNIRLASIFSSNISDIKLKASTDKLEITARNSDRGEIVSSLPCTLQNDGFEISLNYNYLLDGLKVLPTDNVVLGFTGDGAPLVLKGENQKDQLYMIMPLRN